MGRLLMAMLLALPALARAAPWPIEFTNPKPAAGDLSLPLPCEGALTLRAVDVPTSPGVLGDRPVTLGQADTQTPYADFTQRSFLAGAFGDAARGTTRYFIGKYEITRDQYAAVMEPQCPAPSEAGSVPITDISWFDAVAFTAKLSTWWLANAKSRLPMRDTVPAFARLPTEEEWEFAARGGVAVDDAAFRDPLPSGDPLGYAWLQGPRSAGGRIRPIGRLAPNPLGIFDMIGNASEWVLEPFRLNKVGRAHGQPGGAVARGPHFQTDISQARTSLRTEYPPFSPTTGAPLALPTIGFRIALGTQAGTTEARLTEMGRAFAAESGALTAQADDPVSLVARLRDNAPDEPSRRALLELEARLRIVNRAGQDSARIALRGRIQLVANIAREIRTATDTGQLLGAIRDYLENSQSFLQTDVRPLNEGTVGLVDRRLRDVRDRIDDLARAYLAAVSLTAQNLGTLDAAAEANAVATEFTQQQQPQMAALARLAATHAMAAKAGRPPDRGNALAAIGRAQ